MSVSEKETPGFKAEVKADLNLLLECLKYQMNNPDAQRQALQTITTICSQCDAAKSYLHVCGGLQFIFNLAVSAESECVREIALYCVASCIENNGAGQVLVMKSGCLQVLIHLFRTLVDTTTSGSEGDGGGTDMSLWSSVVSTLCVCVNNPHNEDNQTLCGSLLPFMCQLLKTHRRVCLSPLSAFIGLTTANNVRNQARILDCGGLQTLLDNIRSMMVKMDRSSQSLAIRLVNTLDVCVVDNVTCIERVGQLEVASVLLALITKPGLSIDDQVQVILTMGHTMEGVRESQEMFQRLNGVNTLIQLMGVCEDEELSRTIKYALQVAVVTSPGEVASERVMPASMNDVIMAKIRDISRKVDAISSERSWVHRGRGDKRGLERDMRQSVRFSGHGSGSDYDGGQGDGDDDDDNEHDKARSGDLCDVNGNVYRQTLSGRGNNEILKGRYFLGHGGVRTIGSNVRVIETESESFNKKSGLHMKNSMGIADNVTRVRLNTNHHDCVRDDLKMGKGSVTEERRDMVGNELRGECNGVANVSVRNNEVRDGECVKCTVDEIDEVNHRDDVIKGNKSISMLGKYTNGGNLTCDKCDRHEAERGCLLEAKRLSNGRSDLRLNAAVSSEPSRGSFLGPQRNRESTRGKYDVLDAADDSGAEVCEDDGRGEGLETESDDGGDEVTDDDVAHLKQLLLLETARRVQVEKETALLKQELDDTVRRGEAEMGVVREDQLNRSHRSSNFDSKTRSDGGRYNDRNASVNQDSDHGLNECSDQSSGHKKEVINQNEADVRHGCDGTVVEIHTGVNNAISSSDKSRVSHARNTVDVKSDGEIVHGGGEYIQVPQTMDHLNRIYGEKSRIKHVIGAQLVKDALSNENQSTATTAGLQTNVFRKPMNPVRNNSKKIVSRNRGVEPSVFRNIRNCGSKQPIGVLKPIQIVQKSVGGGGGGARGNDESGDDNSLSGESEYDFELVRCAVKSQRPILTPRINCDISATNMDGFVENRRGCDNDGEKTQEGRGTSNRTVVETKEGRDMSNKMVVETKKGRGTSNRTVVETKEGRGTSNRTVVETKEGRGTSNRTVVETKEGRGTSNRTVVETKEGRGTSNRTVVETKEGRGTSNRTVVETKEGRGTSNRMVVETKEGRIVVEGRSGGLLTDKENCERKNCHDETNSKKITMSGRDIGRGDGDTTRSKEFRRIQSPLSSSTPLSPNDIINRRHEEKAGCPGCTNQTSDGQQLNSMNYSMALDTSDHACRLHSTLHRLEREYRRGLWLAKYGTVNQRDVSAAAPITNNSLKDTTNRDKKTSPYIDVINYTPVIESKAESPNADEARNVCSVRSKRYLTHPQKHTHSELIGHQKRNQTHKGVCEFTTPSHAQRRSTHQDTVNVNGVTTRSVRAPMSLDARLHNRRPGHGSCWSVRSTPTSPSGSVTSHSSARRSRVDYTQQEVVNLLCGVKNLGTRWTQILWLYDFHPSRTAVDLKDKYRRLQASRAPTSRLPATATLAVIRALSVTEEGHLEEGVRCYGYNWPMILASYKFGQDISTSDLRSSWHRIHNQ